MKPHITIIAHVQWGTLDPARLKFKDARAAIPPAHGGLTMRTQQSMLIRCNTNKSRDSDIVEIFPARPLLCHWEDNSKWGHGDPCPYDATQAKDAIQADHHAGL